ncbi:MAG: VWA domain-containing protein [Bryobacterales bacterium]|nr:VWA domain-containing protein [Bryobacterales bacterium]
MFGQALAGAAGVALAQEDPVIRVTTREVVLHATVVDKSGRLVTNLTRDAFTVTENNAPQALVGFRREDVPVSLGIVIDNSGSMRDKRTKVAGAALTLVKESNPQDEMFIVNFNDEAYLDQTFTSDHKKLEEALAKIDSRGGTAMRDATTMSLDYLREKGKKAKKVLLLVSDGDDNTSAPTNTLEKLVAKSQQTECIIYAIGVFTDEERGKAKRAERALNALVNATGGLAYFPKDIVNIEQLARQVAHEIRNQYVIAYRPSNETLDGSYRRIGVQVKGPNRPVARTRSGYYATPDKKEPARPNPAAMSNSLQP